MTRICIVGETDPFVASLLQRFAEASGLQVVRVQVGQDLPELVRQIQPDVIILDAELPGKTRGWEAARTLKVDTETSDIPIITCSWLSEAEASVLIGEVSGHLQKPELHYEDFLAALRLAGVKIERPFVDQDAPSQFNEVE
jgi:CheY-like chemotaxis protein